MLAMFTAHPYANMNVASRDIDIWLSTNPGAGTSTRKSSFVDLLDDKISHIKSAS